MNTQHKQRGVTFVLYLLFATVLAAVAIGTVIYIEMDKMQKTIKEQQEIIGNQKTTIETLEQANRKLLGENETLSRQIDLMKKIAEDNDAERLKRETRLSELTIAYKNLSDKLPGLLNDSQVGTATKLELANSTARISYIWDVFKLDYTKLHPSPLSTDSPSTH